MVAHVPLITHLTSMNNRVPTGTWMTSEVPIGTYMEKLILSVKNLTAFFDTFVLVL